MSYYKSHDNVFDSHISKIDEHRYPIIVSARTINYSYALPDRKCRLKYTQILLKKIRFWDGVKLTFTDITLFFIL